MVIQKRYLGLIAAIIVVLNLLSPMGAQEKPALPSVEMVLIEGGEFEMGDTFNEGFPMEKPVHKVKVNSFYLGKYEVTFAEYDLFAVETNRPKPDDGGWGREKRPVINISWYEALAYCNWLSQKAGLIQYYTINNENVVINANANGYRLPTEAEWEYAARERGKKVRFGNGKDIADPKQINFNGSENLKLAYSLVGPNRKQTLPVGSFSPNALGLYDMSGNVAEWCYDYYDAWYYKTTASADNPHGPAYAYGRVARGGSWLSDANYIRAANRGNSRLAENKYNYIGFRLARNAN